MSVRISLLGIVVALGVPAAAWSAVAYQVTPIGSATPGLTHPRAITESGQIVGSSGDRGFLYRNGQMTYLGLANGEDKATGINNFGHVVGWTFYYTGGYVSWVYDGSTYTILPTLGHHTWAAAINDAGQIVGESLTEDWESRAFLVSDGNMTNLGALGLGGASSAMSINQAGTVVGEAQYVSGSIRYAFRRDGNNDMVNIGAGPSSTAWDVNNLGQIVGEWNGLHAFLHDGTRLVDISFPGSFASYVFGINDSGDVVGRYTDNLAKSFAYLYGDGRAIDLNDLIPSDSGWVLTNAVDINNRGQIIGSGRLNGVQRGFVLTPIPEPTVAGMTCALLALLVARRPAKG